MAESADDRYRWWNVLRESSLTPTAHHVALTISTYMNKSGGGAWPSMSTLADDTNRSRRTVARAVSELVDVGFLEIESGGGRRADGGYVSNRYVATVPNGVTHDTANGDEYQPGAVTSGDGAVSSEPGAVSSETGSGVTHGTGTTHELAIQHPKQHSAPTGRAADAAGELFLVKDREAKEQKRKDEARQYGEVLRKEIDRGKLTVEQAGECFDGNKRLGSYWREFNEGLATSRKVAS